MESIILLNIAFKAYKLKNDQLNKLIHKGYKFDVVVIALKLVKKEIKTEYILNND